MFRLLKKWHAELPTDRDQQWNQKLSFLNEEVYEELNSVVIEFDG